MTDYNEIFRKEIMNDTFCDVATYYSHYFESEYYKKMSRLWKRAAKKWRKIANEMPSVQEFMHYKMRTGKAEATATSRLELLRRCEKELFYCPCCKNALHEYLAEFTTQVIGHAEDCELARELGDET